MKNSLPCDMEALGRPRRLGWEKREVHGAKAGTAGADCFEYRSAARRLAQRMGFLRLRVWSSPLSTGHSRIASLARMRLEHCMGPVKAGLNGIYTLVTSEGCNQM
jgi:hypothetical protein